MAYATVADVQARLARPLTDAETAQATALLTDVEAVIRSRIPDLDDQVTDGTISEDLLVMIEANAVIRVLRNPGGYRSESVGGYSYQVDTRAAAGFLLILDSEWGQLGVTAGAFTIVPYLDPCPTLPGLPDLDWS